MCTVCGGPALYPHFGTMACDSCRVFFRRNANKKQNVLKCHYNNDCKITIHNRHICAYCRLEKCFQSGMSIHMIRAPRTAQTNTTHQPSLIPKEPDKSQEIPILNLIQSNQSMLALKQWNLISDLTNYFDDHSGFSLAQHFIKEQNQLPPKTRFKLVSVTEFHLSFLGVGKVFYEKTLDFISLGSHDRSILLHNTMKYVIGLSACFITCHGRLLEYPTFDELTKGLYEANNVTIEKCAVNQIDNDGTFIKLILAMLPFTTFNYTYYTNMSPVILTNMKSVLDIQDTYTDLIWRYLVYKYSHESAVLRFLKLIRCLFLINDAIVTATEHKDYTDMIDLFVKQTEETLSLIS